MKRILTVLTSVLASRAFFWCIWIFFILQAVWIAVSALYPLPFDEDFHFGIIQIYSHQVSPFLTEHPAGADIYGAITRDPSYFFHWLMSFPYRWFADIFPSQTTQIIALRLLNIAMFAYAIVLFRKVMLQISRSPAFTNTAIALMTLIPIVPQLAAHINYDNLLMILVAWACLLVIQLHRQFIAHQLDIKTIVILTSLCMMTSIVKYAFLPIFIAIGLFVGYELYANFKPRDRFISSLKRNWSTITLPAKLGLLALLIVTGGFFMERYAVNTVRYHTPVPSCDQVLSLEQCKSYGPWGRNYLYAQTKGDVDPNPLAYSYQWAHDLWWRLFFNINSPAREYVNYPPLPVPAGTALVIISSVFILTIVFWRKIFRSQPLIAFCMVVIVLYCGILWGEQYSQFLETGQPVAINGRYLIIILPLIALVGWRAFHIALARAQWAKPVLATLAILLFLHGGGTLSFILRSDESWYWPGQQRVIDANNAARKVLSPVIIEGSKYY